MHLVSAYLRAFGWPHTYSLRNAYVLFGFLWGIPIPVFSLALHLSLVGWQGRSLVAFLGAFPVHIVFLAHPCVFALVFGAMGTLRQQLAAENSRLIEELRSLAVTDPLTGIFNRRFILDELQQALLRSEQSGQPVSVALFDMDNFKEVNERFGHLAGDRVLRDVAEGLRSVIRKTDAVGRYGGDEFLLVTEGDRAAAEALVQRARQAVSVKSLQTTSAGIATSAEDGTNPTVLIAAADRRLASQKTTRRASSHDRHS